MHHIRLETCVQALQHKEKESNNESLLYEAQLLMQEDVSLRIAKTQTEDSIFKDDTQKTLLKSIES